MLLIPGLTNTNNIGQTFNIKYIWHKANIYVTCKIYVVDIHDVI